MQNRSSILQHLKMKLVWILFLATTSLGLGWLPELSLPSLPSLPPLPPLPPLHHGDENPLMACDQDRAHKWNQWNHAEPNEFTAGAIDTLHATKQALDSIGVPFFIASGLYCTYMHTYTHTYTRTNSSPTYKHAHSLTLSRAQALFWDGTAIACPSRGTPTSTSGFGSVTGNPKSWSVC